METAPPTSSPRRPIGVWIVAAVLAVAAGTAAYIRVAWRPARAPIAAAVAARLPANEPLPSLGGTSERNDTPPLDASDTSSERSFRRSRESCHPWRGSLPNGLIRNFTVVVAQHRGRCHTGQHLTVLRRHRHSASSPAIANASVDPRSYDRYAVFADAIASVDPSRPARLYGTLKHGLRKRIVIWELPISRSTARSNARSLRSWTRRLLDGAVRLKPKGIGYAYADERLDA